MTYLLLFYEFFKTGLFAIGGGILEAILGRFNRPCYIRRGILHCPVDKNVPTA